MLSLHDENRLKERFEKSETNYVKRKKHSGDCQFCFHAWSNDKPTTRYSIMKGCKGVYFEGMTNSHCDDFKWRYGDGRG